MRAVVHAEGFTGLYKGLQAQLIKTVLAAAFALTVKEKSFRAAMLVVLLANRCKSSVNYFHPATLLSDDGRRTASPPVAH